MKEMEEKRNLYKELNEKNKKALAILNIQRDYLIKETVKELCSLSISDDENIENFLRRACQFLEQKIERIFNFIDNNGCSIGIFGCTTAGKSQLINCLIGKNVATVAEPNKLLAQNTTKEAKYYEYTNGIKLIDTEGLSATNNEHEFFKKMIGEITAINNNPTIDLAIVAFSRGLLLRPESVVTATLIDNEIPVIFIATRMTEGKSKELVRESIIKDYKDFIISARNSLDAIDKEYGLPSGSSSSKLEKIHFISSVENFGMDDLKRDISNKIDLIKINRYLTILEKFKEYIPEIAKAYLKNMDINAKFAKDEAIKTLKSKNGILDKPLDQKDTANIKKMFSDIWKAYGFKKEIERAENPDVITTFGQVGRGMALTISFGISYWFFRSGKDTLVTSECDKLADECIKDARKSAEESITKELTNIIQLKFNNQRNKELSLTRGKNSNGTSLLHGI